MPLRFQNLNEIQKINEQKPSYNHIDRIFSTIKVFDGFSYLTLIDLDRYNHQYPKTIVLGVIQPLTHLQNKVTSNLDNSWIRKINDYHKKISMMTPTQKYFDDRELKIFEMKANPKVSEKEILFYT